MERLYLGVGMWPRKDGSFGIQLVTILLLISKETVTSSEYSIQLNQEVKIPADMCAIVPCKFVADNRQKFLNSKGYWKQGDDIVASTDKSEGRKQNFHAIGDPNNGDCTLKITNARKEDDGNYYFRFEESKHSVTNYDYLDKPISLQVTDIPEVDGYSIQLNQNFNVRKGLSVTIPCTFTADHMKSFTNSRGHWKTICHDFVASSDKSMVGVNPNFQLMGNPDKGDCTLMITDAKEQDSGKYYFRFEAEGKRKFNYLSKMITIQVSETATSGEYSIQLNQEVKIPEDMCAIVPCKFVADSRQKFLNSKGYWKQGDDIVASTDKSEGRKQNFHALGDPNKGDCTLKITNARKEDNGNYYFRFEETKNSVNRYNYLDKPISLQVTDIPEVNGYSIQVNQNIAVQKGLSVTIPCMFTADHMKSFTNSRGHWKTICHEFVASSDKSIVGVNPNFQLMGNPDNGYCTLMITDAKEQHSGKYYFRFEDAEGKRELNYLSKMITIQVSETVTPSEYSIQFNQDVRIPEGTCAIVSCKFVADSRQKFLNSKGYWMQDDVIVSSADKSEGTKQNFHAIGDPNNGDCTLKITNARKEDDGNYFFRFEESKYSMNKHDYLVRLITVKVTDIREVNGYSIQVNQTVTVQKDHCVIIPCTFTAYHMKSFTNSRGHWKTICHEFVASSNTSIVGVNPNFQLMGNPDNGDCTLMITDAKEQDSGKYYFRYEDAVEKQRFSHVSKMITVQVTDRSEKPVISDPGILTEGKRVTLTCTAPGGCPNALITWRNQTGIWTDATSLTFVPTRSHHQTSLTCQVTFSWLKHYIQNEITLSVQYPPSVTITTKTSEIQNTTNQEVTVQEGTTLALKCSVDSNPRSQMTWVKGAKNVLIKGNGNELILYLNNITASGADKYHCLAQNNLAANNQTISILVQYSKPTISDMITWLCVTVIIIVLLIGLGIFGFVRHRKKRESGQADSGPKRKVKRRKTADKVDEGSENIYMNMPRTS